MSLSTQAQNIQNILTAQGMTTTVVELAASTRTAEDAARAIGCTTAQIVKSLIFRTKKTKKPVLVLASGPNRVNERLLLPFLNEDLEKADADFVRTVTGFAIGGVAPIGHPHPILTFIDEDLMQHPELWAAAGTPHAVFKLTPSQLLELTEGQVMAIK